MKRIVPLKNRDGRITLYDRYGEFIKDSTGPSDMAISDRSSRGREDEFHGISFDQAANLGATGDVATAQVIRRAMIREANKIMGQMTRLDPVYKLDGGTWIDVSRYLSGEPEVWGEMVDAGASRRGRKVSIVFGVGVNCFVSAKDYERVTTAIGGAVLGLKASGVAIQLYACYRNDAGYPTETDILAVNMTPGGAFNITHLAALSRNWFFRRLVFSWWECREESFREKHDVSRHGGYGSSKDLTLEDAIAVTGIDNPLVLNTVNLTELADDEIRDKILGAVRDAEKIPVGGRK